VLIGFLMMIRRLLSTFIDFPSNHITSEFFHPQTSNRVNFFSDRKLDNLNFLLECAPCFALNGKDIRIISEPKDFYETLLQRAASAKKRICLASLYLGVGKLESDLLNVIETNARENEELRINILLDYTRGTRGKKNSKAMLMPLIQQSQNCNLSLYHTPLLRGITKRLAPARWNELLGLQHMKIYLFDNTIVISGANLSNDYFTNRQDRYIEIQDQKLANFFSNLLEKVQEFSMKVDKKGGVHLHESWKLLPYESDHQTFANEAKKRIQTFFTQTFEEQRAQLEEESTDADTWIFPTLEMGQLNIHHDSVVMKRILGSAEEGSKLNMATGYFNLTDTLMDTIVRDCGADCSIVMAHPNANGFKGAKGPAGGIPDAYSLLAKKFYDQIKKHGQENRISLLEYERDSWTYHAKGLWYTPQDTNLPCMTVVGSSNYGERSVNRDLESQVCLVTKNKALQKALQAEYDHLTKFATTAENQLVTRFIPKWVQTVVFLFKNFF
jgi:CDP-diacylglycerol---glycerol-3-phosphate 3-phosphatidyltransferase